MNVIRVFTYAFDDPDWLNKLAITAIVTALSVVFTPLLIGLVGWAVLFGYMVALVRGVRLGVRHPMPRWDDFNAYLSSGVNVVVAAIVYSLPNLVLTCVSSVLAQNMGGGLIGSTLILALSCCLFPILLIYNLVMLPALAVGMGRYVEEPRINVFFEFSFLFATLRQHLDRVVQWWLAALAADIIFIMLAAVVLIGWVPLLALLVPVYGMLTGLFARDILGGLKEKPKNPPPAPRRR
ncbi:MAG: DUF4013 domain-containing protein [Anaerolineae bacterium]|nr:DUF4013 domain-containing protein [Anaerolineae bacterium]